MSNICRTCLHEVANHNLNRINDNISIKNQLSVCIPEMGASWVSEPVMCKLCVITLQTAYDFICQCLKTEERILNFRQENGNCPVDLFKMLSKNKNLTPVETVKNTKLAKSHVVPLTDKDLFKITVNEGNTQLLTSADIEKASETSGDTEKCPEAVKRQTNSFDCKVYNVDNVPIVHAAFIDNCAKISESVPPNSINAETRCNLSANSGISNLENDEDDCTIVIDLDDSDPESYVFDPLSHEIKPKKIGNMEQQVADSFYLSRSLRECAVVLTSIPDSVIQNATKGNLISSMKPSDKKKSKRAVKQALTERVNNHKKCKNVKNRNLPQLIPIRRSNRYICSECGYNTTLKVNLQTHVRIACKNRKPFSCSLCAYKTSRTSNLKRHVKNIHFFK